jgi:hypothetical protein
MAGKVGGLNIGTLFALDNRAQSYDATSGDRPFFGIARLRSDLGRNSTLGAVLTTREDGSNYSRLAGADARIYHSKLYFVEVQAVQSWTRLAGADVTGPLFQAMWDRTGRDWGFNYSVRAIAPDFQAAAGFVNRTGIIDGEIFNRLTGYGKPNALVQTYGAFIGISRIFDYQRPGDGSFEGGESVSPSATLRGGWSLGGSAGRNFYSFDPADYAGYSVETPLVPPAVDTLPFVVPGPERNVFSGSLRVTTPTYRLFTLSGSVGFGETVIFREAAPGRALRLGATLDLRPFSALRVSFQVNKQRITRDRDGSQFSNEVIPRLKLEYQLTRAIFFRFVGQYTARELDALYDRNGNPILIGGVKQTASTSNEFRTDWLFSYRPIPGTLLYLGYGSTMVEPDAFQFQNLQRTTDGFFGKVSYLFRL